VDDQPVSLDHQRAWQRTVAHVPQSIFLADTTIAENIAFGTPPEQIDLERVRRAANKLELLNLSKADLKRTTPLLANAAYA